MFNFIFKAFLRDKTRSLIPIIVVSIGVFLTVSMTGYMRGTFGDMIDMTAKFQTGHVKVMTRAFAENSEQLPNDLCLLEVEKLQSELREKFPNYIWENRILFGGIVDRSNAQGETLGQGACSVMAIDLSENSNESKRLNIAQVLSSGAMPQQANEVLLGYQFAEKLGTSVGDTLNFMGSTMNGSMSFSLYIVAGTVRFGNATMDKNMILMDVKAAQQVMDMADGASMILGFHKDEIYHDEETVQMAEEFNLMYMNDSDEFLPTMQALRTQNNMGAILDMSNAFAAGLIFIFIIVMSIVLWNTGLVAGLRRYQEFGIRLAVGERKNHIYLSQIAEATLIGFVGSIIGTALSVLLVLYLQKYGIDITGMLPEDAGMMMPNVLRAKMSADLLYLGFVPGVFATVLGAVLSGRGIYKRQTSRLMKEMEI